MVHYVFSRIQFWFMIFFIGASFVVWFIVSPSCSDCNPVRLLNVDYRHFPV